MTPKIITSKKIKLVGMSFYGDPFKKASGWSEDNEIGILWNRLITFLNKYPDAIKNILQKDVFIEIHLMDDQTDETGEYEVFTGIMVEKIENIPLKCVAKILPETDYAVFTLKGKQITDTDWWKKAYEEWIPNAGYKISYNYNFQYYDNKFKGLDKLENSQLDFYFPVQKIIK
jgi:AraC family transcriptional regulator